MSKRKPPNRVTGFTLVELLVVIAIVGILAAIAVPSYFSHIAKANRADAKAALLQNAQFLERTYTESNSYAAINTGALPVQASPTSGTAAYTITVATSSSSYVLSATPTGSMTGDDCGTYTLDQTGAKGSGGNVATCWNN